MRARPRCNMLPPQPVTLVNVMIFVIHICISVLITYISHDCQKSHTLDDDDDDEAGTAGEAGANYFRVLPSLILAATHSFYNLLC